MTTFSVWHRFWLQRPGWFLRRPVFFVFRFDQDYQNRIKEQETKDEKWNAAFTVKLACQNRMIHVNRKKGQSCDSKRILEQQYWNCGNHKQDPSPRRSQEEMACKEAGHQQTDPRTNAAAFLRNFNHQVGQADHVRAFPEDGSSRELQNHISHFRGTTPQNRDLD
jgi:hypothetical protein